MAVSGNGVGTAYVRDADAQEACRACGSGMKPAALYLIVICVRILTSR